MYRRPILLIESSVPWPLCGVFWSGTLMLRGSARELGRATGLVARRRGRAFACRPFSCFFRCLPTCEGLVDSVAGAGVQALRVETGVLEIVDDAEHLAVCAATAQSGCSCHGAAHQGCDQPLLRVDRQYPATLIEEVADKATVATPPLFWLAGDALAR